MADGVKGAMQNIGEAVVKPVMDEVGKAIEVGVQSVLNKQPVQPQTTSPIDPMQQQQISDNEQVGLVDARRKIKYWQDLAGAQARVREEQKKKEQDRLQVDTQKKQIKQFEIQEKKKDNIALKQSQIKTEVRKGVGG